MNIASMLTGGVVEAFVGEGGPVDEVLERVLPEDPEAKREAKRKLAELRQKGELERLAKTHAEAMAQTDINLQEAKSESMFIAGWRPAIGWICGTALAYGTVLYPFLLFAVKVGGVEIPLEQLPQPKMETLMPVLLGMLGLGGMRSWEKGKGVNKNR